MKFNWARNGQVDYRCRQTCFTGDIGIFRIWGCCANSHIGMKRKANVTILQLYPCVKGFSTQVLGNSFPWRGGDHTLIVFGCYGGTAMMGLRLVR
jgi:hypothetical protein